jgi:hypothetical protein
VILFRERGFLLFVYEPSRLHTLAQAAG